MSEIKRIKFVDFFDGFDKTNNEFLDALGDKFEVIQSDTPDYLIYSGFGQEHLKYECIRIFYTGECQTPDFNECDYAIGFDRLNFGDRYVRIPLYNLFQYKKEYESLKNRKHFSMQDIKDRGFCSFVVSNCFSESQRSIFFEKLSEYKKVASGGRYKNNIGGAVINKKSFLSKYKFNIAFENSIYDGYVTEKIMEAFAAGVVPIYYGDPKIENDFNPKAFVNVNDFKSFEEVINRVKEIDGNDEIYLRMLNEPIIYEDTNISSLRDFLLPIFERPLIEARRRPDSEQVKNMMKERRFLQIFDTRMMRYYYKIRNQIFRYKTDTILTSKRTK